MRNLIKRASEINSRNRLFWLEPVVISHSRPVYVFVRMHSDAGGVIIRKVCSSSLGDTNRLRNRTRSYKTLDPCKIQNEHNNISIRFINNWAAWQVLSSIFLCPMSVARVEYRPMVWLMDRDGGERWERWRWSWSLPKHGVVRDLEQQQQNYKLLQFQFFLDLLWMITVLTSQFYFIARNKLWLVSQPNLGLCDEFYWSTVFSPSGGPIQGHWFDRDLV